MGFDAQGQAGGKWPKSEAEYWGEITFTRVNALPRCHPRSDTRIKSTSCHKTSTRTSTGTSKANATQAQVTQPFPRPLALSLSQPAPPPPPLSFPSPVLPTSPFPSSSLFSFLFYPPPNVPPFPLLSLRPFLSLFSFQLTSPLFSLTPLVPFVSLFLPVSSPLSSLALLLSSLSSPGPSLCALFLPFLPSSFPFFLPPLPSLPPLLPKPSLTLSHPDLVSLTRGNTFTVFMQNRRRNGQQYRGRIPVGTGFGADARRHARLAGILHGRRPPSPDCSSPMRADCGGAEGHGAHFGLLVSLWLWLSISACLSVSLSLSDCACMCVYVHMRACACKVRACV